MIFDNIIQYRNHNYYFHRDDDYYHLHANGVARQIIRTPTKKQRIGLPSYKKHKLLMDANFKNKMIDDDITRYFIERNENLEKDLMDELMFENDENNKNMYEREDLQGDTRTTRA